VRALRWCDTRVPRDGGVSREALRSLVPRSCLRVEQGREFERDIALLEAALQRETDNTRYMFYLAQSYREAGRPLDAVVWYEKRAAAGGISRRAGTRGTCWPCAISRWGGMPISCGSAWRRTT